MHLYTAWQFQPDNPQHPSPHKKRLHQQHLCQNSNA